MQEWFGGVSGPSGEHLIALMRHSDAVFAFVLQRASRTSIDTSEANAMARLHILNALSALDGAFGNADGTAGHDMS